MARSTSRATRARAVSGGRRPEVMAGTVAARASHGEAGALWAVDNRRGESWAGWPRRSPCLRWLVEELDELPAARHGLQPQRHEHRSLASTDHRHRIHQARGELLDLDAQHAGATDWWPTGPLDPVGDRVPQAGVADPLELAGRAQPGLDLADGQRQRPGGDGRVRQGWTDTGSSLLALGEFLVGEVGRQQRGWHGRLPGRSGRRGCLPVPEGAATGPQPGQARPASPRPVPGLGWWPPWPGRA